MKASNDNEVDRLLCIQSSSFSKNLEKSKILKQDLLTFWCELAESTAEFFPGQPCWLLRAQPASVFLSCQQTETPLSSEQNNNNGYKKNKKTNEQFQNLTKTNHSQSIHYSLIKITYVTSKPNLKKYHAKEENFVKSEQERPEIRIIQRNETSLKNLSVTWELRWLIG